MKGVRSKISITMHFQKLATSKSSFLVLRFALPCQFFHCLTLVISFSFFAFGLGLVIFSSFGQNIFSFATSNFIFHYMHCRASLMSFVASCDLCSLFVEHYFKTFFPLFGVVVNCHVNFNFFCSLHNLIT